MVNCDRGLSTAVPNNSESVRIYEHACTRTFGCLHLSWGLREIGRPRVSEGNSALRASSKGSDAPSAGRWRVKRRRRTANFQLRKPSSRTWAAKPEQVRALTTEIVPSYPTDRGWRHAKAGRNAWEGHKGNLATAHDMDVTIPHDMCTVGPRRGAAFTTPRRQRHNTTRRKNGTTLRLIHPKCSTAPPPKSGGRGTETHASTRPFSEARAGSAMPC